MIKFAAVAVSAAVMFVGAMLPRSAWAQAGDLDPTFGNGGFVSTDFFNNFEEGRAIALAPDGKIVVAGTLRFGAPGSSDFIVARYNADGSLDNTFGFQGRARTDLNGGIEEAGGVVVQDDGKIVVAGLEIPVHGNTSGFAVVRYNANGTLDARFGVRGKITTQFDGFLQARSVALQPDGKIVVGGDIFISGENQSFLLARYTADGFLDETFAKSGIALTDVVAPRVPPGGFGTVRFGALAVQPDGKIIAAGSAIAFSPTTNGNFAMVRYNPNGSLDASFGNGGIADIDFGGTSEQANAIALQADGKIVLAGETDILSFVRGTMIARFNADGSPDVTFGQFGASKPFPAIVIETRANAVAIQADGEIVTAGEGFFFTSNGAFHLFAVERFDATGAFDRTFGKGGLMLANVSVNADGRKSQDVINGMILQDDGKIVAAGSTLFGTAIDVSDVALARFQP